MNEYYCIKFNLKFYRLPMKITAKHRSAAHQIRPNSNSQSNIRKFINPISNTKEQSNTSRIQKTSDSSMEAPKSSASNTPNALLRSVDDLMRRKAKGIAVINPKSKNSPYQHKHQIKYSEGLDHSHDVGRYLSEDVNNLASCFTYKVDYHFTQPPQPSLLLKERDINTQEFHTNAKLNKNYTSIKSVLNTSAKQDQNKNPYFERVKMLKKHKQAPKMLSLSDFSLGNKVGRGRFGNVYIAQEKATKCIYAIKMINVKRVLEEEMVPQIINEIKIQSYLCHSNILKMYSYFRDGDNLCMVLEYADEKCLFKHMRRGSKVKPLPEDKAVYYAKQVLSALKYLHSEDVLHRDIKPENLLLCSDMIKIGDFGWAAYAPSEKRTTFCGTPDYVSPEIIRGEDYDEKTDVWSMGVLLYELVTGHAPFEGSPTKDNESETLDRILKGNLHLSPHISPALRKLILRILTSNPESRLTLQEIEQSQWLSHHHHIEKDHYLEGIP